MDRLEEARDAGNRTACAGRTHEAVQCLPALPPELGARRAIVGIGIGDVFELVFENGAFGGLGDRVGPRAVGAWVGKGHARALRDGGPEDSEQLLFIVADVLGDRQVASVALGFGNHGQRNARVAACGLHDGTARLELAGLDGRLNQRVRCAVFHRSARMLVLALGHDRASQRPRE